MDQNIKKLAEVIFDISNENSRLTEELKTIRSSVSISKADAKVLVSDFDYIMENVRKAASGSPVEWEEIVCELGFGVYSVIGNIKKQC